MVYLNSPSDRPLLLKYSIQFAKGNIYIRDTLIKENVIADLHTKDENYGYTFLPAWGNSVVKFKVKARSDAHVILSETTDPYSPQSYYEVRTVSDCEQPVPRTGTNLLTLFIIFPK